MSKRRINNEDDEFILDRDYSLDGGVTMVRNDFQHGFENKRSQRKDLERIANLRSRILKHKKGESMKTLQEIMAKKVSYATPETPLVLVAKNMISFDCGEVPIVKSEKDKSVVGVLTDRDIVCRTLGQGKNPMNLFAKDCMTKEVITIDVNASVPQCIKLMRDNKIRRIPVIDKNKHLCGIVSLSDLVVEAESEETTKLFHDISTPGHSPSALQ